MATDPADAASTAWIPALCSPLRSTLQFAERDLWNIASVRFDTGELHHLGPLFGFLCDQLAELRRRSRQRHAAEVGETGLHLGVGESRIDLFVELVDDLCGRVRGNAKAVPLTRLVAREELAYRRDVRQQFCARRGGHCECAQPVGLDVRDRRGQGIEKSERWNAKRGVSGVGLRKTHDPLRQEATTATAP